MPQFGFEQLYDPIIALCHQVMVFGYPLGKFLNIFTAHLAFCLVACGMEVVTSSVNGKQSVENRDDYEILKVVLRNSIGSAVRICFETKLYFRKSDRYNIITAINNS